MRLALLLIAFELAHYRKFTIVKSLEIRDHPILLDHTKITMDLHTCGI